jgi:hypothetical protein
MDEHYDFSTASKWPCNDVLPAKPLTQIGGNTLQTITEERVKSKPDMQISAINPVSGRPWTTAEI